ncbi:hypothetical protein BSQ39_13005 [Loigolactobacillus backii]|uniref:prophage endopeptidase tail family protein n=1 Tax=Loigolactobacillus backii TaxID=375175 RepID=UPI000C1C9A33|nr:prophage endopeptidase tail family protein [Loigolactobacillus backii]PIO80003.1 hypothetical protein BSQ39_13005 [Loigolactobacillus backii]
MVIITDTTGATEALKITDLKVTPQLSTVTQLDFTTWNQEDNLIGFNMLSPRALITVPDTGEQFRLSENDGAVQGQYLQRTVTALAVIQDLNDHLVTSTITGWQTLDSCLKLLMTGTQFTYTIHDQINNFNFGTDTFGGDHALDLFLNTLQTDFVFEWTATNYHIDIYKSMGNQDGFVFVEGSDVYSVSDSSDYTTITTHIHGEGKHDDNDKPVCSADYTSSNSSIYGIIDADAFQDDNITDANTLKSILPSKVQDYPLVQYTATLNLFAKAAPNGFKNSMNIGDWGYLRNRNGIDIKTRIVGKELYLQSTTSESTITFGNLKKDPALITAGLQANHNRDYHDIQKIKNEQGTIIKAQSDAPVIVEDGEFDG